MTLVARPTTYNGIRMRSRLEARFAAKLDADKCRWTYEPRAFANQRGQYLPDFQLHGVEDWTIKTPCYIEVRPTLERAYLAMPQMAIIWDSEPQAALQIHVPDLSVFFFAVPTVESGKWRLVRAT